MVKISPPPSGIQDRAVYDYLFQLQEFLGMTLRRIEESIQGRSAQSGTNAQSEAAPADYVVERGVSGIWTWEKYRSGKAECWGYDTLTGVSMSHGSGGMYYSDAYRADLPTGLFRTLQNCQISVDGNALLWYGSGSTGGAGARTQTYYLALPTRSAESATYYVYYHAIGRWE